MKIDYIQPRVLFSGEDDSWWSDALADKKTKTEGPQVQIVRRDCELPWKVERTKLVNLFKPQNGSSVVNRSRSDVVKILNNSSVDNYLTPRRRQFYICHATTADTDDTPDYVDWLVLDLAQAMFSALEHFNFSIWINQRSRLSM